MPTNILVSLIGSFYTIKDDRIGSRESRVFIIPDLTKQHCSPNIRSNKQGHVRLLGMGATPSNTFGSARWTRQLH